MNVDWIAASVIIGLVVFSAVMFVVIRIQSGKSEHPEALQSNASDPTPLNHAPDGSHSDYSASLLSLTLHKRPESPRLDGDPTTASFEVPRYKRRLFFEDTKEELAAMPRRGSQAV